MYIIPGYVDFKVDKSGVTVINHITNVQVEVSIKDKNELFNISNKGTPHIQTDLEKVLYENELIDEREHIEEKLKVKLDQQSQQLKITIMVTEACNFNCKYCYEHKQPKTMTDYKMDVIMKYIQKVVNQDNNIKSLHVMWIGGEPLLEKNKILNYGKAFVEFAKEKNLEYTAAMNTNGYLLDDETFRELLEIEVRKYYIAFDGKHQDYFRPLISGEGTSKVLLKNLVSIKNKYAKKEVFEIEIINNILENNKDFAWYDKLNILIADNQHFIFSVKTIDQLRKDYDENNHANIIKSKRLLKEHYDYLESKQMRTNHEHLKETKLCSAGFKNGYVFRSDGLIVKCNNCLSYDYNNVGLIGNDEVKIDEEKNGKWVHKLDHEKCMLCKNVLTCGDTACPKTRFKGQKCTNYTRPIYDTI